MTENYRVLLGERSRLSVDSKIQLLLFQKSNFLWLGGAVSFTDLTAF